MRYWYDTEFIEDGTVIDLISIGIVAEDGREYYAQNVECDLTQANEWVKANVFPSLIGLSIVEGVAVKHLHFPEWKPTVEMADDLVQFCNPGLHGKPETWGYYSAYDHVALCQLFGTMMDLPKGWPMYTRDIKQLCDALGNPQLPEQGKGEHHALADARWHRQAWEFLQGEMRRRVLGY